MSTKTFGLPMAAAAMLAASLAHAGPRYSGSPADDSVAFRLNAAHTNTINFSNGFSSNLKLLWTSNIIPPDFFLDPIVAGGTVFVIQRVEAGTPGDVLHALRLSDGRELWFKKFKNHVGDGFGAPAYDNGAVFVVDQLNKVYALSASTGKTKWEVKPPKQPLAWIDPVVGGGQVFLSSDGNDKFSSIYGLDEATGAVNWSAKINYGGLGSPAYDGTGVYTAPPCNYYRFDAVTGERDWSLHPRDCHGGGGLSPIYLHGNVFIQDVVKPTTLAIRDAVTGAGKGALHQYWGLSPALYTDGTGADRALTIYGNTLDTMSSWIVATQQAVWTYKPGKGATFASSPIVINGMVFVGLPAATIGVLDADSGTPLNTITLSLNCGADCFGAPELTAGDGVLMVDEGTELLAYGPQ